MVKFAEGPEDRMLLNIRLQRAQKGCVASISYLLSDYGPAHTRRAPPLTNEQWFSLSGTLKHIRMVRLRVAPFFHLQ